MKWRIPRAWRGSQPRLARGSRARASAAAGSWTSSICFTWDPLGDVEYPTGVPRWRSDLTFPGEPAQKGLDSGDHGVRPLADQQVAAVGDHPQGCPEAPCVLHPVRERDPVVGAAPEAEARAA